VRGVLVIFGLAAAFGVAAYTVAWLLLPRDDGTPRILTKALTDRRGLMGALALVPALIATMLLADALKAGWLNSVAWPAFIAAVCFLLIWRNAPDDERQLLHHLGGPLLGLDFSGRPSRVSVLARNLAGVGCVIAGVVVLLERNPHRSVLLPLGGILLVITGFLLIFGPWWLRIAGDFVSEKQAREFAEERADLAARLHDSVLQTLALIQRRADDPATVRQLARAQERDLRAWLFDGRTAPGPDTGESTIAGAVRALVGEVESLHGVRVEAVTVGDCAVTEGISQLLSAGREATVNAAKWSGADVVSVFVEVEPESVSMFVRDRGRGFAVEDVSPDRRGISDSIRGRMERHGGTASVESTPGEGTEVALTMPRRPEQSDRSGRNGDRTGRNGDRAGRNGDRAGRDGNRAGRNGQTARQGG
jgi:signal transduction histidine kinase